MVYLILAGYILLVFLSSLRGTRAIGTTPEGYFLANRNLSTLTLFFTILATNFSAYYFIGFAGEGYRRGYAFYVLMSLGTALACLSFFLIGDRVWRLGQRHRYITAAELVHHQSGSRTLGLLVALVMVVFTLPYLALQIVGAGYLLEAVTEGGIPYLGGATLLTGFTIAYVFIGGMTSVARTDLKQGILMFGLMLLAVAMISNKLGGLAAANEKVFAAMPELFSRAGADGYYTPRRWFSWLVFWLCCIPMFPQIFMRFYIARSIEHLKRSAILYAAAPLILSILPVIIGVLGHLSYPGLEGKAADEVLPQMLVRHTHPWFAALIMTGALAAFMSTLDSQLLALSTIMTRDFWPLFGAKPSSLLEEVKLGKAWVVIFALTGLLIAWRPFATIFDMGKMAFSGLAMLFPAIFFLLRAKNFSVHAAILSIALGELGVVAFYYRWLPAEWAFGFEPFIPLIALCFAICGMGTYIRSRRARAELHT